METRNAKRLHSYIESEVDEQLDTGKISSFNYILMQCNST